MAQFERISEPDVFLDDSNIIPIVISYSDKSRQIYDEHNDDKFSDVITKYLGVHDCVFINDGLKGVNPKLQILIVLEDVGLSIRVQIGKYMRSFFAPSFFSDGYVIPNDENEYIRRRCHICIENNDKDVIDIVSELGWGNRLPELKSFIQNVSTLQRPMKEIRKDEDQAIWASYAEGLEALTKAKQELRKLTQFGKIHKEQIRANQFIDVLDLEIAAMTNSDVLKQNVMEIFDDSIRKPHFDCSEDGRECSITFDGFKDITEDEIAEISSLAEESCYKLKSPIASHKLRGEFHFKSTDTDKENIVHEIDTLLKNYDDAYPKKIGNKYEFNSDNDVSFAKEMILNRFGTSVNVSLSTESVVSFTDETNDNLTSELSAILNSVRVIQQDQFFLCISNRPIDLSIIDKYPLLFDSCRVRLNVSKFNPEAKVPTSLSIKDGFYYGIIHDITKIDTQAKGWPYAIQNGYRKLGQNIKCSIAEYVYAFKKTVDKEAMKLLARSLGCESSIKINTALGRAFCSPISLLDYEEIKEKISSALPHGIIANFQEYTPSLDISFLSEDENYKEDCFVTIEKAIPGVKFSLHDDVLYFRTGFDDEESRDRLVEKIQKVAEEYSQLFELKFENIKGTTAIVLIEDDDLKENYERSLRSDFGRQSVNLIPSSYDDINRELNDALFDNNRDAIKSLSKAKRELLYNAELIGTCINRTRNTIKVEVCKSFAEKLETNEISLRVGDYIQFPLIGEAININRQKDAIDRILKPGTRNRYNSTIPEAANPNLSNFLFDPRYAAETISDIAAVKEQIKEHQIESNMNDRQREAVAKAIEAQDIAFIQGPPGTGKTTVIAEIIWQEILRNPKCKILLTSQTNTAVDNALERLRDRRGIRPIRIPKIDGEERMVREGKRYLVSQIEKWTENPSEENSDNAVNIWIDTILKKMDSSEKYSQVISRWKADLTEKDKFVRSTFSDAYTRNVNLVAATCSICGSRSFNNVYQTLYGSNKIEFDVVIMDEASKATPLEMAIPMVFGRKIILIGDHKQLPPMVDDGEVQEALRKIGRSDLVDKLENIKESQFKRLFEASQRMRPSLVSTLDTQYRMHKQIMNCITHFYKDDIQGGLKCGIEESMDSEDWNNRGSRYHGLEDSPFINPNIHAIWVDVDGQEEKIGHSPRNIAELKAIEKILKHIRTASGYNEYISHCTRPEDEEIGIITFYGAQVKELQKMHKAGKLGPGKFKIDVVDSFQGMERNIVIISTVRTKKIGFAKEIERINVAFSRAKRLLIVVGDKDFFARNPDYKTSIAAMDVIGINQLS